MLHLADTLCQLIAIPSVNPMGKPLTEDEPGEARLTDYLENLARHLKWPHRRQAVEPGRENLVIWIRGSTPPESGGPIVLFSVHQDTVPVTGMTVAPFSPRIEGGRWYGRGACDVKGGMAAMLSAMSRLFEERPAPMPTLVLACTVNEECGFTGARALPAIWGNSPEAILPRPPDVAIVAEPTGLQVVVAHKGLVRWRCHTRGRAAHSSRPDQGDSAIYKMGRVVLAIEQYQKEVVGTLATHELCGSGTVSVGMISGGVSVNTVPDRATIEIDRRLSPGEDPLCARQHLIDYLANQVPRLQPPWSICAGRPGELPIPAVSAGIPNESRTRSASVSIGADLEHDEPFMTGLALAEDANGPLADMVSRLAREVAGESKNVGVAYATDALFLAAEGIPTVVFGPGYIEQAHTAEEWISMDQLEKGAEIYYRFAKSSAETVKK